MRFEFAAINLTSQNREGRGEHDNPDLERSDGNRASDAIMEGANSRRAGGQKDEEKKDKVSVCCYFVNLLLCKCAGLGLKSGAQVARIFQIRCGRSGKQQQEQNSPNLGRND